MKVLFLKDVPGVALGGEVKEVKNGYARNYLIPYNIAVLANNESLKQVEKIKVVAEKERVAKMEDLKKVFESMQNLTINIPMLSAQTGKLYGSVGHDMISGALKESKGIEVEERYIPHSVNTEIFQNLEHHQDGKKVVRDAKEENSALKGKFLFFWNNRNARRKQAIGDHKKYGEPTAPACSTDTLRYPRYRDALARE